MNFFESLEKSHSALSFLKVAESVDVLSEKTEAELKAKKNVNTIVLIFIYSSIFLIEPEMSNACL